MSLVRLGTPAELKTLVTVPRGYAVVIGISAYRNLAPANNLAFAKKDAENFYSALIGKEAGNMEFENVRKLIGPQATLENIRDALEVWLPSRAQETDRVVVYFVGHGIADQDGRGYLAPYDIDLKKPAETALSHAASGRSLLQERKGPMEDTRARRLPLGEGDGRHHPWSRE